jgi:hypothetical protein
MGGRRIKRAAGHEFGRIAVRMSKPQPDWGIILAGTAD